MSQSQASILLLCAVTLLGCSGKDETNGKTSDGETGDTPQSGGSPGHFTRKPIQCGNAFVDDMNRILSDIKKHFTTTWFDALDAYVTSYRTDAGTANELEALTGVMFASSIADNVYPFCVATMRALKLQPENPLFLNSAAVCLMRLGHLELAGRTLDCAYEADVDLYVTFNNIAYWYNKKGDVAKAIEAKKKAVAFGPNSAHSAWNGSEYASDHDDGNAQKHFFNRLPSNYPIANGPGVARSTGKPAGGAGQSRTAACCICRSRTSDFFPGVVACHMGCRTGIECFYNYCRPSECCGQNSPFSLAGNLEICLPPAGVQACIGADTNGVVHASIQGSLGNLVKGGVKASLSFSEGEVQTGVSLFGTGIGGAGIELGGLKNEGLAGTYNASVSASVPSGPVSIGIGLSLHLPTAQEFVSYYLSCKS